jgi:hypothetical protein
VTVVAAVKVAMAMDVATAIVFSTALISFGTPMYYEIEPGWLLQEGAHIHVVISQVNQIDLYYGRKPNSG